MPIHSDRAQPLFPVSCFWLLITRNLDRHCFQYHSNTHRKWNTNNYYLLTKAHFKTWMKQATKIRTTERYATKSHNRMNIGDTWRPPHETDKPHVNLLLIICIILITFTEKMHTRIKEGNAHFSAISKTNSKLSYSWTHSSLNLNMEWHNVRISHTTEWCQQLRNKEVHLGIRWARNTHEKEADILLDDGSTTQDETPRLWQWQLYNQSENDANNSDNNVAYTASMRRCLGLHTSYNEWLLAHCTSLAQHRCTLLSLCCLSHVSSKTTHGMTPRVLWIDMTEYVLSHHKMPETKSLLQFQQQNNRQCLPQK